MKHHDSLLTLYNTELADYVRKVGRNGTTQYDPVNWPWKATHRLVATRLQRKEDPPGPFQVGEATSVCAEPIRPRLRRTVLRIRRTLRRGSLPAYRTAYNTRQKKNLLIRMLKEYRVVGRSKISAKLKTKKFGDTDCDELYKRIRRAESLFRSKRRTKRAGKLLQAKTQ